MSAPAPRTPVRGGGPSDDPEPDAHPGAATTRSAQRSRPDLLPYVLVAPVVLFIVVLGVVPAGFALVGSFFRVAALDPPTRFDGLGNFRRLASDPVVVTALGNTALYVLVGVGLSTVLGIAAALVLQHPFRGRSLVIAVLVLPWALPGVVEGILWSGIFDPNIGLINSVLSSLGLSDSSVVLLGQDRLLTIALIELVQVWQITPLSALLVLSAMQLIPGELYEAVRIDGCSTWRSIRHITLPLARPGIAVAMVQAIVQTINVFDQPYILNGAALNGTTATIQTYTVSFQDLDFGKGYALSLVITIATLVASLAVVRLVYRKVDL